MIEIINDINGAQFKGADLEFFIDDDKDVYDFEEFTAIQGIEWNEIQNITIPIGQKIAIRKQFPYTVNPYNCVVMDSVLRNDIEGKVTTQNANLLFEYGTLCENNLFVCLAEEVLSFSDSVPGLTQKNFLDVYFPNLVIKDNITSLEGLENKIQLYDETAAQINSSFEKYNEKIDLLYNIYYKKKK